MNKTSQQYTLSNKRLLGYAEFGDLQGYPILYCHGSQSSRLEMHYDVNFAEQNNLRIITIDRPGHGLSDFNPKGTILSFAQDVIELADHLQIRKFSVAGMSAGSPFALVISYSFPERVYKTAIISGFAPFTSKSKKYLSKQVKMMLNLAKNTPFLLKIMLKIQAKQLAKKPKEALNAFLKILSEPDQKVLKNKAVMQVIEDMYVEAFRNGTKGVAHEISKLLVNHWGFEINQIKTNITFWQGKKDNNVPFQWAEIMANDIENAQLNFIEDEGHLIIFKHAETIFRNLK